MDEAEHDGRLVGTSQADGTPVSDSQSTLERPAQAAPVADIHAYIGSRLRKAFDDVASQPVPDRFVQLMQLLDKQ